MSKSDLLARAEAMIDGRFADNPALQAHMLVLLASRYYEISDYPPWRKVLARAYELARRTSEPRLRAVAACELAMAVTDDDPERAQALLSQANVELAAPGPCGGRRRARPVPARRGDRRQLERRQFERAIAAAEESLRFEASRPGPSGRGAEALNTLGLAQGQLGRFEAANATFERLFAVLAAERRTRTRLADDGPSQLDARPRSAGQIRRALAESDTRGRRLPRARRRTGLAVQALVPGEPAVVRRATRRGDRHRSPKRSEALPARLGSQVPFWIYCIAARVQAEAGRFDDADLVLAEMDRAFEAIPFPARRACRTCASSSAPGRRSTATPAPRSPSLGALSSSSRQ